MCRSGSRKNKFGEQCLFKKVKYLIQEEQDRFRERSDALERATETARTRLDEEKEVCHQLRSQLESLRQELKQSKESVEQLSAKVRTTAHKVIPDPETGEY